jgi:predicted methyltransferase
MKSLWKAMKPGGTVLLIDFKRIPGTSSEWTLGHVRAGQDVFEKEITSAGFEKTDEVKGFLIENYFVKFRKKEAGR